MALANCPRCGALFNKLTVDCCKECYEKEEKLMRQTQEFLRKNRNASMFELLGEISVEQWMVEKWIKDKRITMQDPAAEISVLRCSSCGREIKPGQLLCTTCQFKRLASKTKPTAPKEVSSEKESSSSHSSGMHIKPR